MTQLCACPGQLLLGEGAVLSFPIGNHVAQAAGHEPATRRFCQPRGRALLVGLRSLADG